MADLVGALASLYDGGDVTIFQATVDAVGQGVLTIHVNGGTFTDVPFIPGGFYPASGPSVNDPCYVIGRKGWGMVVLGKPADGPTRATGGAGTFLWEPTTFGSWYFNQRAVASGFTASTTGDQLTEPTDQVGYERQAVWFYTSGNPLAAQSLSSASLRLGGHWTAETTLDWNYVEIGLHTSLPNGTDQLHKISGVNQTYRFPRSFALGPYAIPLDWVNRLRNGTATGIYAEALDQPMTFTGSGELSITTL